MSAARLFGATPTNHPFPNQLNCKDHTLAGTHNARNFPCNTPGVAPPARTTLGNLRGNFEMRSVEPARLAGGFAGCSGQARTVALVITVTRVEVRNNRQHLHLRRSPPGHRVPPARTHHPSHQVALGGPDNRSELHTRLSGGLDTPASSDRRLILPKPF